MISLEYILLGLLLIKTVIILMCYRFSHILKDMNDKLSIENIKLSMQVEILGKDNKILTHEIAQTKSITKAFFPKREHINNNKFDIYGVNSPSNSVSGDYYDVFSSGINIYFGIGDVTGHGLSSSILSLLVSRRIRTLIDIGNKDIPSVLESCNNEIVLEGSKYMSLLLGKINSEGLVDVYGKQESIIVCRAEGVEVISDNSGFILGNSSFNRNSIPRETIEISSNDFIILYTDGVTELENGNGEALGIERLVSFITKNISRFRYNSSSSICQEIVDLLVTWGADQVQDDITMLVVKKK